MDGDTPSPGIRSQLNQAIRAFQAGDTDAARDHVGQALAIDPESEIAWLWLAELSDEPGERLYCLNEAARINPESAGRRHRDRLRAADVRPSTPAPIADLDTPVPPPSYRRRSGMPEILHPGVRVRKALHLPPPALTPPPGARPTANRPPARRYRWAPWLALLCVLLAIGISIPLANRQSAAEDILIAVAGPMSGPESDIGIAMRNGATLAAEDFNRKTKGPHIALVFFDDQGDPEVARTVAETIVANPRIVGVIGHGDSAASLAAAPVYQRAGIPAITAQSTADELVAYPDYFRTIFSNRTEGILLGTYLHDVMKQDRVSIVTGEGQYEQELTSQFRTAYTQKGGTIPHVWTIAEGDSNASIAQIVAALKADPNAGMVLLTLTEDDAHAFLLASRRAGIPSNTMFGSETMGSERFPSLFASEPEEIRQPGYFTDGLYAVSPLIYDAVGADTLVFQRTYEEEFGVQPGWRPAKIWDAVTALATAASRADIQPEDADIDRVRSGITAKLHDIDGPDSSFRGLSGPFYFTTSGDSPQGFSVGQFQDNTLSSAPTQYRLVTNLSLYDMKEEIAAGRAFEIDGAYVRQYRVVYIGVEMIELRDLDLTQESFDADFFLAFRYNGDDKALDISFPNATTDGLALGTPVSTSTTDDGMHYVYFRVQGTFNVPMDFRDYPWDQHRLLIRFQNNHLTQNDIVYVVDPASQAEPMEQRLASSFDQSEPFDSIPNWQVMDLLYAQASVTTTADTYDTNGFVQYSEFRVVVDIERNVTSYLLKNLLPLALLSLVTYVALWFPPDQASARVSFAITSLLSSAVMLGTIASQMPDIGYIVAIEWGYYAYITLAAFVVMLSIAVGRSYKDKRYVRVRQIDIMLRTLYPLVIAIVVGIYWWVFYV
ncbi:MAG TPA: ABC transporter substrate-binding protein [Thermomicrobiales bacterium]|nr:ABC transporter substrate-binding protein [Thermomicrobiales bacterium]